MINVLLNQFFNARGLQQKSGLVIQTKPLFFYCVGYAFLSWLT